MEAVKSMKKSISCFEFSYPDGLTPPASLKHSLMSVMSFFQHTFSLSLHVSLENVLAAAMSLIIALL